MNIVMMGMDFKTPIDIRETFSLTESRIIEVLRILKDRYGFGTVILSTCNRTEYYFSTKTYYSDEALFRILAEVLGYGVRALETYFYIKRDEDVVSYTLELACGLHSLILGEDQIITQMGEAMALSLKENTGDPVINTLFRRSVTCGKKAKSEVNMRFVSPSIVSLAIDMAKKKQSTISNILVIGNGEIGRLAATTLREMGHTVTMTLRHYKYKESIVPEGVVTILYSDRLEALQGTDMIFSATKSPHYTLTVGDFESVDTYPKMIFDLALPRDIDPKIGDLQGVTLYGVDDIKGDGVFYDEEEMAKVKEIIQTQKNKFKEWFWYYIGLQTKENND